MVVDKGDARGQGPAQLPGHSRELAAAVPVSRGAEKDPVQLEYLAAIEQQTGEDWTGSRHDPLDGPATVQRHAAGAAGA